MRIILSDPVKRHIIKLPVTIQKKLEKQLMFLAQDVRHPSLHARKMTGDANKYEARIDYHYRFTYDVFDDTITILAVGPHDTGLGKK